MLLIDHRFERLGELGDLENAISSHRDAADLTPRGHAYADGPGRLTAKPKMLDRFRPCSPCISAYLCLHMFLNNTQSTTSMANPATDDSANAGLPGIDPPRPLASARCACARWPPATVLHR